MTNQDKNCKNMTFKKYNINLAISESMYENRRKSIFNRWHFKCTNICNQHF